MTRLPDRLTESPVDFETAVAYALQPVMRRLIILYVVGLLLLPVGLELIRTAGRIHVLVATVAQWVVGIVLAVAGATLLFGGLVGAVFKIVTDANRLATAE